MKTLCILIVTCAALLGAGRASAGSLDDAHRAFAEGRFHASTLGYQAVLAQEGFSAPVLFDLGNSWYREGNFPQAILAYRRAQWLAPGDPDIAANLQLAQKQAGLAAAEPAWTEKIGGIMSVSCWAWLASGALAVVCASLWARAAWPRGQSLFSLCGTAAIFILATAIAGTVLSSDGLCEAVVIDQKASALISPFPGAQVVFSPSAGETVTVEKRYDNFFLVKDPAGHTGWIDQAQITSVIPAQS